MMHDVIETLHSMENKATPAVNCAIRWISELKSTIEERKIDVDPAIAAEYQGTKIVMDLTSGLSSDNSDSNMLEIEHIDSTIHSSQSPTFRNALVHRTELLGLQNLSRKSSATEIQMTVSRLIQNIL